MFLTFALVSALAAAPADTIPEPVPVAPTAVGPVIPQPVGIGAPIAATAPVAAVVVAAPAIDDDTTPPRRRKAVQISDAYAVRLKIHYIASFATLPIFAAQAIVGEQLYNNYTTGKPITSSLRNTHEDIAWGLGALFLTNTVTGTWNWWETRHEPKGLAWRTVHAALMLVADAGFAYTASLGERVAVGQVRPDLHRNMAEASAGVALVSYIMMWKPIRGDK
jgi:hypothetical protein